MKQTQLFFDLDRTLWDFETNSKNALQHIFDNTILKEETEHFLQFHYHYVNINAELWHLYGKGKITKDFLRVERFKKTLSKLNIDNDDLSHQIADMYVNVSPYQTTLFPNAHACLEELKRENYRMHIITNGFKEVQFIKLKESKLLDFFDVILCSEEVGVNKPDRKIFEYALSKSNCKTEDAIMIGDDFQVDILGALGAGWNAIHFDPQARYKLSDKVTRIRDLKEVAGVVPFMK